VYETGGRMVLVQPLTQMVVPMVLWVTAEYVAPGVQFGSGNAPRIPHWPEGTTVVTVGVIGTEVFQHAARITARPAIQMNLLILSPPN
jgi:hypothetical protein